MPFVRTFTAALCAALCLAVAACGSSDSNSTSSSGGADNAATDSSKPLKIGRVLARTGFMSAYDVPPAQAEDLWAKQINAKGGIDGRKVEFIDVDTKTDASLVGTSAIKALDDGAEALIVSCDFDWGAPAAIEAQKRNVVAISECAGSSKFGPAGIGPLAYTMGETAAGHAAIWAEFGYDKMGWRKAYVLTDPTLLFEKESADAFKQRFTELGGQIVGSDEFQQKDVQIATQINRIKSLPAAEQPDVILVASYPPGLMSAVKQMRAAGIDTPIIGDVSWDGESWKKSMPNVSDIYFNAYGSLYGDDPDPKVNQFFADYEKETGKPALSSFVLTGYGLMQVLQKAIETAGTTDGAKVAAALDTFKNVPTVLGPTTFTKDQHADVQREMSVMKVENGKTSFVTRWRPKEVPAAPAS